MLIRIIIIQVVLYNNNVAFAVVVELETSFQKRLKE